MNKTEILSILTHIDHTLLTQTATDADIEMLCDEAIAVNAASVCVPPCYVSTAKNYLNGKVKVCTVIGFPNGYNTTACKIFEAEEAIKNGADEIDMVINIGKLKSGDYSYVLAEIEQIKDIIRPAILKVIVETAFLTDEEKEVVCNMVTSGGADYIKTSTGFAKSGANLADIAIFKKYIGAEVKIKAAGGIRTINNAKQYLNAGCDRIGASAIIKEYLSKK